RTAGAGDGGRRGQQAGGRGGRFPVRNHRRGRPRRPGGALMRGRVLVIAGSDSGGGAGIQADIKTITMFGAYAATAITALTAQNTLGVEAVHVAPLDFVARQIDVVMRDIGADVVKTGMLVDAGTIEVVCEALARYAPGVPVVVDPV